MFRFLAVIIFVINISSCDQKKKGDLFVTNATIYTVNDSMPTASAMVVKDGKILAIGSTDELLKLYTATQTINAKGKFIYPGFIDAHCHFTGYATDQWKFDVVGTNSWESVIDSLVKYSRNAPMQWLYGRGWDQNDWDVKTFPDNRQLDSLFPDRPVFIKRIDGHAAIANSKALELAGVTTSSLITGGSIEVKNNKLTGLLVDNAMGLVENVIPHISDSLAKAYYAKMQEQCFAYGLTGVHDCGVSEHTVELVEQAQNEGTLKMKIFALLTDSAHYYKNWLDKGPYIKGNLHVGGFKVYADGALGSRGACLLQPYADQKDWNGFLLHSAVHFDSVAQMLAKSKLQMCTHAIGDSANRIILGAYAKALQGKNDRRWRIEHAQVVNENDFNFFSAYSIIPSIQPTHATSDMYWAAERLGASRMPGAYAYKTLLQQNGWLPLGTDFPVESISPFKTFFATVVRQDAKGYPDGGFQMENALSRMEALKGMTIWAAKAAFEEKDKGSLEVGKAGDFVMLDKDLMKCAPLEILNTTVLATYLDGKRVYGK